MASKVTMLLNRRPQSRHRQNEIHGPSEEEDGANKAKKGEKTKRRSSCSFARLRRRATAWLGIKRRRKLILTIILLSPIILRWILRPLEIKYFGDHDMEGGELGAKMDRRNRRFHRRRIEKRRRARLEELGLVLPPLDEARNEKYLTITSDILTRRAERKLILSKMERGVKKRVLQCESSSASFQDNNATTIPRHIIQPNYGPWFRPRNDKRMSVLPFEEHDMQSLIQETFPTLSPLYDRCGADGRVLVWSLCALYEYGGYVFGKSVGLVGELVDGTQKLQSACDNVGVFHFFQPSNTGGSSLDFLMLAASPRHPLLQCTIDRLGNLQDATNGNLFLESLYSSHNWNASTARRVVQNNEPVTNTWEVISSECSMHQPTTCCDDVGLSSSEQFGVKQGDGRKRKSRVYVKIRPTSSERHQGYTLSRTQVSITERPDTIPPALSRKYSVRDAMKKSHCDAGWRCNRCLHNPVYGTYESCRTVCDECFVKFICNNKSDTTRRTVAFDVIVRRYGNVMPGELQIPRVVHQTWFESLAIDRYPQLTRVQSSWKNAGFQYRFYTDVDARDYIATNFPSRFLNAYDALVPGAFKADLFRLFVLLKDGGIYADSDVLLGANLNAFITPSMSFFVPLDLVGADYDEEFCLWNGIIGSAPGHPILVEAVEWLVNMILNRADAYDFERQLCRDSDRNLQVWKVRQGRLLLLSGPCALGMAANRALGKSNPVARIKSGWLVSERNEPDIGESLVLRGDKFDMNAFRFTDVDRNLIVASTDMIDLTSTPIEAKQDNLRKLAHYSETEAMDDVFGAKGVYIDNLVTNEEIRLEVTREYLD